LWRAVHSRVRSSGVVAHSKPRRRLGGDRLHRLGLLLHAGLAAVELHQQHRRLAQAELRGVDRAHGVRVEQLAARDRHAHLDDLDGRVDRRADAGRADRRDTASGSGYSFSVISVITPSVPSLPTNRRVRS
jgi:hypothetical protein